MASPVLFSTGQSPAATSSRNLVEFKAGKMEMRDKMVHPIKKPGLVYLRQSDDSLMHFCWKDRQTGSVEDDLILFPDDCEFKRVKECTTGRVYVLKMKSSSRKMFFWMQEAQTERDDELCKKVNDMLNNPPRAGAHELPGSSERDLQTLFGNMTQEQVAQLLSSNGVNLASILSSAGSAGRSPSALSAGSQGAAAGAAGQQPAASPSVNDIRALITNSLMEQGSEEEAEALTAALSASRAEAAAVAAAAAASNSASQQQQAAAAAAAGASNQPAPPIDLSAAINSDSLAHLLEDQEFMRQVEPHLPPVPQQSTTGEPQPASALTNDQRKSQFRDTVRSSQFRSSLSQFCIALQSGQLGPLMSQFGLSQACVDAANLGNLEAFVRALEAQTSSTGATSTDPATPQQQPRK